MTMFATFAQRNIASPLELPPPIPDLNEDLASLQLRMFSYEQLASARDEDRYEEGARLLIGLKDYVFDVTSLKAFIGPQGPLNNYPWRDISWALVKSSNLASDTANQGYNKFSPENLKLLDDWTAVFLRRFVVIGRLSGTA
ncbi:hypothetical protein B0H16DRAFT_1885920 [Mycena metata]|uniref:Uncharacterized protein n=1 Tax=Mycena metata TaxID=1033252 RepID=A0AAD7NEA3_9AGAR|nr:hypothetical protein B0H16DRAFT_1885920 [Mycena metata]